jgi:transglutaminase-like putative cysteine protease
MPIRNVRPIFNIRHVTTYRYANPVAFGEHRLMVHPRDDADLSLLEARLEITPAPTTIRTERDAFGNLVTFVSFAERASELRFESTLAVEHVPDGGGFPIDERARFLPVAYDYGDNGDLAPFMGRRYDDREREVERWLERFLSADREVGTLELLAEMTGAIQHEFVYRRRPAKGIQTPAETLRLGSGSCRDLAVLMIEAARTLGLAARFVSGYLHVASEGPGGERGRLGGGATHAWVQVNLPGAGWIDYDPTNGIIGNAGLIRVAAVADPEDAVPLSGSWFGGAEDSLGMSVDVEVSAAEPAKLALLEAAVPA